MSSRDQAMPLFSSASIAPLLDSALLDALLVRRAAHDAFDKDARRVDVVGVDASGLDQMLDLCNGHFRGRRHHRVEVARGLPVDEVAFAIGSPPMNDRTIDDQATLQKIALSVEVADVLALRHQGADTCLGEECRNAGAAGPYPLRESTLGIEFEFELATEIKIGKQLVFADIRRDHFADLAALEEQPEPGPVDAGVVRDHSQAIDPGFPDQDSQRLPICAETEPATHNRHTA